jgi:hypothetical protein
VIINNMDILHIKKYYSVPHKYNYRDSYETKACGNSARLREAHDFNGK